MEIITMKLIYGTFLIILVFSTRSRCDKWPAQIKRCNMNVSSIEFDRCLMEAAKNAIPLMRAGIKEWGLGPIEPFRLPADLEVSNSRPPVGIVFRMANASAFGPSYFDFTRASYNKKKDEFTFEGRHKNLTMVGNYHFKGTLFSLSTKSTGLFKIEALDVDEQFSARMLPTKKVGYVEPEFTYKIKKIGRFKVWIRDSRLPPIVEKTLMRFANANWELVTQALVPTAEEGFKRQYSLYLGPLFRRFSYAEIVLGQETPEGRSPLHPPWASAEASSEEQSSLQESSSEDYTKETPYADPPITASEKSEDRSAVNPDETTSSEKESEEESFEQLLPEFQLGFRRNLRIAERLEDPVRTPTTPGRQSIDTPNETTATEKTSDQYARRQITLAEKLSEGRLTENPDETTPYEQESEEDSFRLPGNLRFGRNLVISELQRKGSVITPAEGSPESGSPGTSEEMTPTGEESESVSLDSLRNLKTSEWLRADPVTPVAEEPKKDTFQLSYIPLGYGKNLKTYEWQEAEKSSVGQSTGIYDKTTPTEKKFEEQSSRIPEELVIFGRNLETYESQREEYGITPVEEYSEGRRTEISVENTSAEKKSEYVPLGNDQNPKALELQRDYPVLTPVEKTSEETPPTEMASDDDSFKLSDVPLGFGQKLSQSQEEGRKRSKRLLELLEEIEPSEINNLIYQ